MDDISMNNEVMKTLLTSNAQLCLPPRLVSSTNTMALPKQVSSVHYTQAPSHPPPLQHITNDENLPNNRRYSKSPSVLLDRDTGMIALEHCYARPLNWKPENSFYQPTKLLFMQQQPTKKKASNPLAPHQEFDDSIDVEFVSPTPLETYDKAKAFELMEECDRHVEINKLYQTDDDWEESIIKINWTPIQHRLFNGMANILNNDQLARLVHTGSQHEPIKKRIVVDQSVKRVRQLFSTISWDTRLAQWIHQLLLDHLNPSYLSAYLDILQTLKAKLPNFVDKMLYGPNSTSRIGPTSIENLFQLFKRPWDPFSSNVPHIKLRKLPGNPVFIIVPSAPSTSNTAHFKRQQKWINLLSNLATVVAVHTNIGNNANRLTMINCADQMLSATRAKVQEVKVEYSGRTIILVGFNAGSALALQVAQVESVYGVVCIGFSVLTAEGRRGDPDDSLLELQCPVLFVIGQCSNTSSQEDIEDLRERMRVENGLIVVGSADDYLRINKKKKRAEGITQNAVDRVIAESIGEFITGLLLSPYPPQVRQSPTQVTNELPGTKHMKIDRTRNNSNGSSLESEPPSPTPKVTRPVGRPPGSKSKNKLEAKWAAQVAQGILPSPPPPSQPVSKPPITTSSLIVPSDNSLPLPLSDTTNIKKFRTSSEIGNSDRDSPIEILSDSSDQVEAGNAISNIIPTHNKMSMPSAPKHSSGIRVLESVTFNPGGNGKLQSGPKQGLDLSKITVLNTNPSTSKSMSNVGNVLLMPDGKIKTISSTVKGTGVTPLLLPMAQRNKPNVSQMTHTMKHGVTKYITSKKQLLGRKPPYPSQKTSIISYSSSLPPPTNLTSQDIMDLPIIFADDNQMLTDNSELQKVDPIPVPEIIQPMQPSKLPLSNPVGKFVFLNKQQPLLQSLATPALKRPTFSVPVRTTANPVKYTKIIISRGLNNETKTAPVPSTNLAKITHLSPEVSIRRIDGTAVPTSNASEAVDLENKLIATAIPKPEYTITVKKEPDYASTVAKLEKSIEAMKRSAMAANFNNGDDDDDPDYIPPKSVKLK